MSLGQLRALRIHLRGWRDIGDCTQYCKKKHRIAACPLSYYRTRASICWRPYRSHFCVHIFKRKLHLAVQRVLRIYTPQPGTDTKLMNKMFLHRLLSCPLLWSLHVPSHSEARLSTEILTTAQRFPVWYYEKVIYIFFFFFFKLLKLGKIFGRLHLLLWVTTFAQCHR